MNGIFLTKGLIQKTCNYPTRRIKPKNKQLFTLNTKYSSHGPKQCLHGEYFYFVHPDRKVQLCQASPLDLYIMCWSFLLWAHFILSFPLECNYKSLTKQCPGYLTQRFCNCMLVLLSCQVWKWSNTHSGQCCSSKNDTTALTLWHLCSHCGYTESETHTCFRLSRPPRLQHLGNCHHGLAGPKNPKWYQNLKSKNFILSILESDEEVDAKQKPGAECKESFTERGRGTRPWTLAVSEKGKCCVSIYFSSAVH